MVGDQTFADRVVSEIGGPPGEQEAKLLVADAWLARLADNTLDPGGYNDYSLTEEILWGLGGDYEWFRLAIYDLEILDAVEDREGRERAAAETAPWSGGAAAACSPAPGRSCSQAG